MSARQLIDLASGKGYGIGRNHSGSYRYNWNCNGQNVEQNFSGGWSQFVKFVKQLPSMK